MLEVKHGIPLAFRSDSHHSSTTAYATLTDTTFSNVLSPARLEGEGKLWWNASDANVKDVVQAWPTEVSPTVIRGL